MILGTSAVGSEALGSSDAAAEVTTLFVNVDAQIFAAKTALAQLQAAISVDRDAGHRRRRPDHRGGQGDHQRRGRDQPGLHGWCLGRRGGRGVPRRRGPGERRGHSRPAHADHRERGGRVVEDGQPGGRGGRAEDVDRHGQRRRRHQEPAHGVRERRRPRHEREVDHRRAPGRGGGRGHCVARGGGAEDTHRHHRRRSQRRAAGLVHGVHERRRRDPARLVRADERGRGDRAARRGRHGRRGARAEDAIHVRQPQRQRRAAGCVRGVHGRRGRDHPRVVDQRRPRGPRVDRRQRRGRARTR